ncbi:MAG TPA: aminodeoxychorismate synthase component I [Bacteroidota bacterium]
MKNRTTKSLWLTEDGMFGPSVLKWVDSHPGTVLLESNLADNEGFLFANPVRIVKADSLAQVAPALAEVESAVNEGAHAAGFLSYEAGYAFESSLPAIRLPETPLLWFGLYERPIALDRRRRKIQGGIARLIPRSGLRNGTLRSPEYTTPAAGLSAELHASAVEKIQAYIAAGDTYQVNFTFPISVSLSDASSPASWYHALRRAQRVPYSAFINTGQFAILSVSPELFFQKKGARLILKPMKGTAPRGRTTEEDELQRKGLEESEKNRAENLMIVDLLRNDAGRIAVPGSVRVRKFFEIERYETVFQATSTITATLRRGVGIADLIRSLFPSGSVTGAPKIRTMQLIHELETAPRGAYTGAIGYFSPNGEAAFSVAIRTAVLNRQTRQAVVGVGSGIVHDSDVSGEYDECLLKARYLTEPFEEFDLIETLRWQPGRGFALLPLHLKRLSSSAAYFGFRYASDHIRVKLGEVSRTREARKPLRVRVLLSRVGSIRMEAAALGPDAAGVSAAMAQIQTDSRNRFLFHKTTRRDLYERELNSPAAKGHFDMIFLNERGEVTEGARSNIILRVGDRYFTPPVHSGLLPGTYRAHLLQKKGFPLAEKILYPDDVASADEILLCNAVRGLVPVRIPGLSPI